MERATRYLQKRFEIGYEEAKTIAEDIRYLDKMDNGENMLCYHELEALTTNNKDKLVTDWDTYEDMLACDSGDLERRAIEEVYGENVVGFVDKI